MKSNLPSLTVGELLDMSGNGQDLQMLEATLEMAEIETVVNEDPTYKYGLALIYQQLKVELPLEAKQRIERAKLKSQGREFVMDMPMNTQVVAEVLWPESNLDQRLRAAATYGVKANVLSYSNMNNVGRSVVNYMEAKRLDPQNSLKKFFLAAAFLDERYSGVLSLLR